MKLVQLKTASAPEDRQQLQTMKLNCKPQTSVRKIGREMNISKDKAHRIMLSIIGFKPYVMYCTRKFYNEDTNLRVEMSKRLITILKNPAVKVMFSIRRNQAFMFLG